MNSITISGRIGRDPEIDAVKDGLERCKFSVAVNRFTKKGEDPITDWFEVTAFGKQGAAIKTYFQKGDQIIIRGRMESYKGVKDEKKTYWGIVLEEFDFGQKKKADGATKAETATSVPGVVADPDIPF